MTKKKTAICSAFRAFKQKVLFRAGVSKKQVSRKTWKPFSPLFKQCLDALSVWRVPQKTMLRHLSQSDVL